MPELKRIPLSEIDEPELAARMFMDEQLLSDLAEDMRAQGLLQPIGLKVRGDRYEIEFGHRRFLAAKKINWLDILAIVFQPGEMQEDNAKLGENLFREDMSAAEQAYFIVQLMEQRGYNEEQLCKAMHKSADWVGDRLRLLTGDPMVLDAVVRRTINFSVARELNKCPDESMRRYFLDAAIRSESGARVVAGWVAQHRAQPPAEAVQESSAPTTPTAEPAPPQFFGCELCGGDRDPYNLIHVRIHKWEWEKIQRAIQTGADPVEA